MTKRAESHDPTTSLSLYLAPLRDHRKVVLLVTLVTVALGGLVALAGPKTYSASTSVLIYPVSADPTEALQSADRVDDMATELRIAESRAVADVAATELQELGIEVTPSAAAAAISVSNPEDSRVLTIGYQASDPAVARVGSELAASAYLAYRSELNAASRQVARTSINDEIAVLQDRLAAAQDQFEQSAAGSPARLVAEVELASIDGELEAQQDALADLSTLSIDAATVFDAAREPGSPDGLGVAQLVVGSFAGGLVLGILAAWTLAAFGIGPDRVRPPGSSRGSARPGSATDDDDSDDADSPFDDSDNRDPLELLKALEAVEADPSINLAPAAPITIDESPTVVTAEPEPEPVTDPAPEPAAETEAFLAAAAEADAFVAAAAEADAFAGADATAEADAFAETDAFADAGATDFELPAFDPSTALPSLTQPVTGIELPVDAEQSADVEQPVDADEIDDFSSFEADYGTETVDHGVETIDEPISPVTHSPLVAGLQAAALATEPEAADGEVTVTIEAQDHVEVDDEFGTADEFGTEDDSLGHEVEDLPSGWTMTDETMTDIESASEDHVEPESEVDIEPEGETSLTTGDPNELDPGPPSWDGPFVGPTTWEQLSAMAAVTNEPADTDTNDPADGDAVTDGDGDLAAETGSDPAAETDTVAAETVEADTESGTTSGAAALVATNDIDDLFERLTQLGSTGPVSVLSLSHRNPAAGLTAGFELADELRAVGANVLLIDVRIERPVLDSLFDDGPVAGLAQVMTGEVVLDRAVRTLSGLDGLDLLTVGNTDEETAAHLVGPAFRRLLSEARLTYHSIVVIGDAVVADDTGQPIDIERARSLAAAVDGLIVGTADPVGTAASDELVAILDTFVAPTLQLVTAPVPADSGTAQEASSV